MNKSTLPHHHHRHAHKHAPLPPSPLTGPCAAHRFVLGSRAPLQGKEAAWVEAEYGAKHSHYPPYAFGAAVSSPPPPPLSLLPILPPLPFSLPPPPPPPIPPQHKPLFLCPRYQKRGPAYVASGPLPFLLSPGHRGACCLL